MQQPAGWLAATCNEQCNATGSHRFDQLVTFDIHIFSPLANAMAHIATKLVVTFITLRYVTLRYVTLRASRGALRCRYGAL